MRATPRSRTVFPNAGGRSTDSGLLNVAMEHGAPPDSRAAQKAGLFTLGLAALWILVAWARPATTFHLAPLFVAGLLPYGYATIAKARPPRRFTAVLATAATIAALGTTGILAAADKLQGPSLLPAGGAVLEAVVFSLAGAALGLLAMLSADDRERV